MCSRLWSGTWVPWLLGREMLPGSPAKPKQAILLGAGGEIAEKEGAGNGGGGRAPGGGGPPTMAAVQAACPTELSTCEATAGCTDVLKRALSGKGADPAAEGFGAFEALFACMQ